MRNVRNLVQVKEEYQRLLDSQNTIQKPHIQINDDYSAIVFDPNDSKYDKYYNPIPSGKELHESNKFISVMQGPFGSGKSTACMFHLVFSACKMPYWKHGRRKARSVIIRNTSGELTSTSLQTWLFWFGELGDVRCRQKPILHYEHLFNDGHGLVELEVYFLALDRPEDIRKLKSFEFTNAYVNELCEVPELVLPILKGRVNHRYPSKSACKEPYWSGIVCDTNPPSEDHWFVRDFDRTAWMPLNINEMIDYKGNIPEDYKLIQQPPGLIKDENGIYIENLKSDNHDNLANDYYTKLAENQSQDFINVYCLGKYGTVQEGKLVYPEFNDDLHSVDEIEFQPNLPILLGFDFGLTPCAIVIQITSRGFIHCLKEYTAENMGIKSFAENILIPSLRLDFPDMFLNTAKADPSGVAKNEGWDELSDIGVLNVLGIKTEPALSNVISKRLSSVRYFLNKMIDGKAAFQLSKKGCPILRKGFMKGYAYKRLAIAGETRFRDEPNKNEYSHIHDALQYVCLDYAAIELRNFNKKSIKPTEVLQPIMWS